MAETSKMLPIGTKAPDFTLLDTCTNKHMSLSQLASSKATVIMFICNHCPYVKLIQQKLVEVAKKYQPQGVSFIAISSNSVESHPQDGPQFMREEAEKNHYSFPYLYDETQAVARAYQAACTPDLYVFDKALHCVYRGRFDDATPSNGRAVTGADVTNALDALLAGREVSADQQASIGCGIKWKK